MRCDKVRLADLPPDVNHQVQAFLRLPCLDCRMAGHHKFGGHVKVQAQGFQSIVHEQMRVLLSCLYPLKIWVADFYDVLQMSKTPTGTDDRRSWRQLSWHRIYHERKMLKVQAHPYHAALPARVLPWDCRSCPNGNITQAQ